MSSIFVNNWSTGSEISLSAFPDIVHSVISPLIAGAATLAHFMFPEYGNVGDGAIWLGEERYLNEKIKSKVIVVMDESRGRHYDLPDLPEGSVVLIRGGGNLGDIWPQPQEFRECLLRKYRRHRIIQFPQSIHFWKDENATRCKQVFNAHPDFHLLVRDSVSLDLANELHEGPNNYVCPDMALCLGALRRPHPAVHEIVGLMRRDREKAIPAGEASEFPETDWTGEPRRLIHRVTGRFERMQDNHFPRYASLYYLRRKLYQRIAQVRLQRGCNILGSGKVVISDRLHAHILCTLMGIPHVILENSYCKIGQFRETWRTGEGICLVATDVREAQMFAQEMISFL